MSLMPIATKFPKIKNLHTGSQHYSPFYVLFINMEGKKCVKVAIVEQPSTFNDREYRRKMAMLVAGHGTLVPFDEARAHFHDIHKDDYITKW